MKFGLAFEDALVPEWRDKYVNYAEGKKLIKSALEIVPVGTSTRPLPPTRRLSMFHGYSMKAANRISPDQAFRDWIHAQLQMVDNFYVSKEREVYERFLLLQDQLYLLRDHSAAIRRDRPTYNGIVDPDIAFQWLHRLELPSLPSFAVFQHRAPKKPREPTSQPEIRSASSEDHPNAENEIRNGKAPFSDLKDAKDEWPSHNPDGLDVVSKIRGGTLASLNDSESADTRLDTSHSLTAHRRENAIDPDMASSKLSVKATTKNGPPSGGAKTDSKADRGVARSEQPADFVKDARIANPDTTDPSDLEIDPLDSPAPYYPPGSNAALVDQALPAPVSVQSSVSADQLQAPKYRGVDPVVNTPDHRTDRMSTNRDSIAPNQHTSNDAFKLLENLDESMAQAHLHSTAIPRSHELSLFPVVNQSQSSNTTGTPSIDPPLTAYHAQSEHRSMTSPLPDQKDQISPRVDSADSGSLYTDWGSQSHPVAPQNLSPVYSRRSEPVTGPTQAQKKQSSRRDYATKQRSFNVSYVYARKQLKGALLEHYRSLTLLRSYRALNRTAFRKITKKFDKTTLSTISAPFMTHVDNLSYMQTSDMVDKLVSHVEDIFIAFFDPDTNDRKHSLERLKSIAYAIGTSELQRPTFHTQVYASGFGAGMALPLLVLAIYVAIARTLNGSLVEGRYILQIWGGFFLLNLMVFLFSINLAVFDLFKINYKFIFEFDMATALDWRQFFVFPSLAFTLFALIMWFGVNDFWPNSFAGRDWPWIYFAIILAVFLWPGKHMYASSRTWLQIALWRLVWSGFYPVEFRDFFLGDILCSLTYTMGNLLYFFCVYSKQWRGVYQGACGSSKSRLLGALSTLPSIWRFLQCMRRFLDTGDAFPHLANMLKYAISILYYALLSAYRILRTPHHRAVFIAFAAINSIYSCVWDVLMDWSLFQSDSPNKLLRPHLFYKRPAYYYAAIVLDVILRFQWVFYACFSDQIQQSAATSFFVAVAEILRRFIWIFFRMENEHCTNVVLFRASKDSPLPYPISARVERAIKKLVALKYGADPVSPDNFVVSDPSGAGPDLESVPAAFEPYGKVPSHKLARALGTLRQLVSSATGDVESATHPTLRSSRSRRRSTLAFLGESIQRAHVKDFQRRTPTISSLQDADLSEEDDDILSDEACGSIPSQVRLPSVKEGL